MYGQLRAKNTLEGGLSMGWEDGRDR